MFYKYTLIAVVFLFLLPLLSFPVFAETIEVPAESLSLNEWFSPYQFESTTLDRYWKPENGAWEETCSVARVFGQKIEADNIAAMISHIYYRVLVKPDGLEQVIDQYFFPGNQQTSSATDSNCYTNTKSETPSESHETATSITCPVTHYYNKRSLPQKSIYIEGFGAYKIEVRHIEISGATVWKYAQPLPPPPPAPISVNIPEFRKEFADLQNLARSKGFNGGEDFNCQTKFTRILVSPSGQETQTEDPVGWANTNECSYSWMSFPAKSITANEQGTYNIELRYYGFGQPQPLRRINIGQFSGPQASGSQGPAKLTFTKDDVVDLYTANPQLLGRYEESCGGSCTRTGTNPPTRNSNIVCLGPVWREDYSSRTGWNSCVNSHIKNSYTLEDHCYALSLQSSGTRLSSIAKTEKTHTFSNFPPINSISVYPSQPIRGETLECDVDATGYTEVNWYVNGNNIATGEILPPDRFKAGDKVSCGATPVANTRKGSEVKSAEVIVLPLSPKVTSIYITPQNPLATETLSCFVLATCGGEVCTAAVNSYDMEISWLKNSQNIGVKEKLAPTEFQSGDRIACAATPILKTRKGDTYVSNEVSILPPLPVITSVEVIPSDPKPDDKLDCKVNATGNTEITWYVNGKKAENIDGTLQLDVGDEVYCSAIPISGQRRGQEVFSEKIEVSISIVASYPFVFSAGGNTQTSQSSSTTSAAALGIGLGTLTLAGGAAYIIKNSLPAKPQRRRFEKPTEVKPGFIGITGQLKSYTRSLKDDVQKLIEYTGQKLSEIKSRTEALFASLQEERQMKAEREAAEAGGGIPLVKGKDGYYTRDGKYWSSAPGAQNQWDHPDSVPPVNGMGWTFSGGKITGRDQPALDQLAGLQEKAKNGPLSDRDVADLEKLNSDPYLNSAVKKDISKAVQQIKTDKQAVDDVNALIQNNNGNSLKKMIELYYGLQFIYNRQGISPELAARIKESMGTLKEFIDENEVELAAEQNRYVDMYNDNIIRIKNESSISIRNITNVHNGYPVRIFNSNAITDQQAAQEWKTELNTIQDAYQEEQERQRLQRERDSQGFLGGLWNSFYNGGQFVVNLTRDAMILGNPMVLGGWMLLDRDGAMRYFNDKVNSIGSFLYTGGQALTTVVRDAIVTTPPVWLAWYAIDSNAATQYLQDRQNFIAGVGTSVWNYCTSSAYGAGECTGEAIQLLAPMPPIAELAKVGKVSEVARAAETLTAARDVYMTMRMGNGAARAVEFGDAVITARNMAGGGYRLGTTFYNAKKGESLLTMVSRLGENISLKAGNKNWGLQHILERHLYNLDITRNVRSRVLEVSNFKNLGITSKAGVINLIMKSIEESRVFNLSFKVGKNGVEKARAIYILHVGEGKSVLTVVDRATNDIITSFPLMRNKEVGILSEIEKSAFKMGSEGEITAARSVMSRFLPDLTDEQWVHLAQLVPSLEESAKKFGVSLDTIIYKKMKNSIAMAGYDTLVFDESVPVIDMLEGRVVEHEMGHLWVAQNRFEDIKEYADFTSKYYRQTWLTELEADASIKRFVGKQAFNERVKRLVLETGAEMDYIIENKKAFTPRDIEQIVSAELLASRTGDRGLSRMALGMYDQLLENKIISLSQIRTLRLLLQTWLKNTIDKGKVGDAYLDVGKSIRFGEHLNAESIIELLSYSNKPKDFWWLR